MVADARPLYAGSDGRYYTCWQVERKLGTGEWRPCLRDLETDRRLVVTDDGALLMLVATDPGRLPERVEVRAEAGAARVVDRRRSRPGR